MLYVDDKPPNEGHTKYVDMDAETEPVGGDGDDESPSPVETDGIPDGFMGERLVPEYDGTSSELSNEVPDNSDGEATRLKTYKNSELECYHTSSEHFGTLCRSPKKDVV